MNKVLSYLIVLVLVFSLSSCSDSEASEEGNKVESNEEVTSNNNQDLITEVSIVETVLLDEANIKITAKEIVDDSIFGTELKLLIENNSDKSLTVQAHNTSVNGYMIDSMMSVDVASGKKSNDSMTFFSSDLEASGIEMIADMEFSFHIFTTEGWDTYLDTPQLKLKTNMSDSYKYSFDETGTLLFDGNSVKIVLKGISDNDSIFGPALILYVHNYGKKAITVQARDVSINGFMMDPIFSEDVMPDKHSISAVTFMSTDLEENGITEFTDAELIFHIFDLISWDTIVNTEPIKIKF